MTTQTQFAHTLHILPPVDDLSGPRWWVYVDAPDFWRRTNESLAELLTGQTLDMLRRLFTYERHLTTAPARRPSNAGMIGSIPELDPRWSVRITADNEDDPLWSIELLDDSAWGRTDSDLRSVMSALTKRIEEARVQPVTVALPHPPVVVPAEGLPTGPLTFEDVTLVAVAQLVGKIGKSEREIRQLQQEVATMRRERRALEAALRAYRKHQGHTPARRQLEAVS